MVGYLLSIETEMNTVCDLIVAQEPHAPNNFETRAETLTTLPCGVDWHQYENLFWNECESIRRKIHLLKKRILNNVMCSDEH